MLLVRDTWKARGGRTIPKSSLVTHAAMRSVGSTQNEIASKGVRASSEDLSMKLIPTTRNVALKWPRGIYAVCVAAE